MGRGALMLQAAQGNNVDSGLVLGRVYQHSYFYPTAFKCCIGIVITHRVRMNGWWEKICPGYNSETIRCRTLILSSRWSIRPMFDQSSVSWYNRVWSLTTSRNRLNLALLYVSQYPSIFYILRSFLHFPLKISHKFRVYL